MATSITFHGARAIEAEAHSYVATDGGWLDLVIKTDDGDVELTCYFASVAEAKSYAAAINAVKTVRKLERVA